MADEPENLALRMLRSMDAKLDTVIDRLAGVRSDISGLRADFVRLEHRTDRFDGRLLRIEKRRDLIEA